VYLFLLDEFSQLGNAGGQLFRAVLCLGEVQVLGLHIPPEVCCKPSPAASILCKLFLCCVWDSGESADNNSELRTQGSQQNDSDLRKSVIKQVIPSCPGTHVGPQGLQTTSSSMGLVSTWVAEKSL